MLQCSVLPPLRALLFSYWISLGDENDCRESDVDECRGEVDCRGADGSGEDAEDEGGGPFAFPQDEGGGGGKRSRVRDGGGGEQHVRRSTRSATAAAVVHHTPGKNRGGGSSSSGGSSSKNSLAAAPSSSPISIAKTAVAITENFWNCNGTQRRFCHHLRHRRRRPPPGIYELATGSIKRTHPQPLPPVPQLPPPDLYIDDGSDSEGEKEQQQQCGGGGQVTWVFTRCGVTCDV